MDRNRLISLILGLPRSAKRLVALAFDAVICALSVWIAYYLRLGVWVPLDGPVLQPMIVSIVLALPVFVILGLYRAIFRYAGMAAIATIVRAVIIYAVPFATIYTAFGFAGVPRTIGLIQPLLLLLMIGASRTFAAELLGESYQARWRRSEQPQVLIYGAGSAGRQLASAIKASSEMRLQGFIDDDPALWNSTMNGLQINGPHKLADVVARRKVTDILLAIPSATRLRRAEIVHQLRDFNLHVRTLPGMLDIARGIVEISDLKDLEIEDLLGRAPVPPDAVLLRKNIATKVVLVSGAGGSIGSELCRQILRQEPATLLLVDFSEYNLYAIHRELEGMAAALRMDDIVLVPLLASVVDRRRIEEIVGTWRPDTIYHAAAYKHVPLVEHNVVEGVRNNVIGTMTIALVARDMGVSNFVLISTDKAVRPTNIMGSTKRLAEMVLQALDSDGGNTRFSMVRFGNVLGSSGSVVPLFRSQIATGGPVTITHTDITRYFMTIPEAAQLVLQAGALAVGGDVFVLDMGDPVRIIDLARNMIELSGLSVRDETNPDGDIAIDVVGLRPGEKLFEELLISGDPIQSSHSRILRSKERFAPWADLEQYLGALMHLLNAGNAAGVRTMLRDAVPEYQPHAAVVDWVSVANESNVLALRRR